MAQSKIEYLSMPGYKPETWNYFSGCSKISAGCAHCWAEGMSKRMAGRYGYPITNPFKPTIHHDKLLEPYGWKKPRMVFVTSMGDTFHEDFSFDQIHKLFDVMEDEANQKHLFLILTKRALRMQLFFRDRFGRNKGKVFPNIWAGVTAENQEQADKRIPLLLLTHAAKRFVSLEPLLEKISLDVIHHQGITNINSLAGTHGVYTDKGRCEKLDWVIVGGESGPGARPMHPDWVRSIRDQCKEARTPFFFKQWGAWLPFWNGTHAVYRESGEVIETTHDHPDCWYLKVAEPIIKTGKKQAGRVLDSKEYSKYPKTHSYETF